MTKTKTFIRMVKAGVVQCQTQHMKLKVDHWDMQICNINKLNQILKEVIQLRNMLTVMTGLLICQIQLLKEEQVDH